MKNFKLKFSFSYLFTQNKKRVMPRFFIVKNKKMTRKKIMLLAQNISLQRSENKIFSDISLS